MTPGLRALEILRNHPGEPFAAQALANMTDASVGVINRYLNSRLAQHCPGLSRSLPAAHGAGARIVWTVANIDAADVDPSELDLLRWMRRNDRAAVPSVIAKATGIDPRHLAAILRRWTREGRTVACELLNRHGVDRFEYRLSGVVPSERAKGAGRPKSTPIGMGL